MIVDCQQLINCLLLPDLPEQKYISAIKELSEIFIRQKDGISEYFNSEIFVSSYTLFYLPTNIYKLTFLLENLPKSFLEKLQSVRLFDFGCGPGTYSLAFGHTFPQSSVYGIDHSNLMIKQANILKEKLFNEELSQCHFKVGNFLNFDLREDFKSNQAIGVLFGNSLNELSQARYEDIVRKFDPDFFIFIEPGTKDFFYKFQKMRNLLFERGYDCLYPCPNVKGECPLLSKNDWCHQVVYADLSPSMHRLCQLASLDRKTLPMLGQVFVKPSFFKINGGHNLQDNEARNLRFLGESKFALDYQICRNMNGSNHTEIWEIPKKNLSKNQTKILASSGLGKKFEGCTILKDLDGKKRVSIK